MSSLRLIPGEPCLVNFKIGKEDWLKFRAVAATHGCSGSAYIREFIYRKIGKKKDAKTK